MQRNGATLRPFASFIWIIENLKEETLVREGNESGIGVSGHTLEIDRKDTGYGQVNNRLYTGVVNKRPAATLRSVDYRYIRVFLTD
ncbi:MAG: hypothetical protein AB7H19_02430 [Porticoccaceae bacterium]